MGHNRGMTRLQAAVTIGMAGLLLGGCGPAPSPPPPVEKPPGERLYDAFRLPLVIEMDVPEAPPEVQKPSPPIVPSAEPQKWRWLRDLFGSDSPKTQANKTP